MALAYIKFPGRILLCILWFFQRNYLLFDGVYVTSCSNLLEAVFVNFVWTMAFVVIVTVVSVVSDQHEIYILSNLFRIWQVYIVIDIVPGIICVGSRFYWTATYCLPNITILRIVLCVTPILLLLLLTTADDSFSSKSHGELVRNLSIAMVADLFDAIEMMDNAMEYRDQTDKAHDISIIFLTFGAVITIIVSSFQMAEYEFIDGLARETNKERTIKYKPSVVRNIFVLVINLVVMIARLKVLIENGKTRSTLIIFKNFIAIIFSVMHICSQPPRT